VHRAVLVRRPVLATTAALLALSLAACGEGGAAESALDSRAQWTQVSMPESSQVAGPRVSFAAALGRSGDLPSLVAGAGGDPGEPASARAFTEAGEDGWHWKELPLPEDSESGVGFAVSDGTTTWIGGTTWQAGEPVTPYVVSSADRTTWKVIDLPDGAVDSALRPGAAAVADGALLIVGMDGEDQPVALHLGDDAGLLPLPAAPDGREFRGFTGIAVDGATVVAVGRAAAPGRTDESVVYRSNDGGATWSADMSLAGGPSEPAGVAVSGTRSSSPAGSGPRTGSPTRQRGPPPTAPCGCRSSCPRWTGTGTASPSARVTTTGWADPLSAPTAGWSRPSSWTSVSAPPSSSATRQVSGRFWAARRTGSSRVRVSRAQ